jgi:hypothetical protein
MKKNYFLLALLVSCLVSNAQIKKGSILLGGQVGFNNTVYSYKPSQPDQKYSNANVNVTVGKAYKENAVFGITAGYNHIASDNNYNGTTYASSKRDGYNAGIFYRRYKKLSNNFYFFGAATARYNGAKETITYSNTTDKGLHIDNGGELSVTPGIAYAICKKLQLEILLSNVVSVNYSKGKNTTLTNIQEYHYAGFSSSLNGGVINNLGFGFQLVL